MGRLFARSNRHQMVVTPVTGTHWLMTLTIFTLVAPLCGAAVAAPSYRPNVDLPGNDYKKIDMMRPRPRLCQEACLQDAKCQAWTFVRTGILGAQASCWLKSKAEPPQTNTCCVSGVK
jgi:PAN domain